MPIEEDWKKLDEQHIRMVPDFPGVFELSDILQEVIFIGKSERLPQTLMQLLDKTDPCLRNAEFFRYKPVRDLDAEFDALINEFKEANNRLPRCNKE
ncbi:MAG TPA: hypothetical protein EYP58_02045 [bacterium (Candidatus Stahlbacteria)]|nr:hypothetical protein [Candidatus Stahlbacteria bacterium]